MKKERMTADNVEQLMDIVRALQQGEEPDPKKRKKLKKQEPDGASEADAAPSEKRAESKDEKDEFEQSLQEDSAALEFERGKKAAAAAAAAASRAAGFLNGLKEKSRLRLEEREKQKAQQKEQRRLEEEARKAEEKRRESEEKSRQEVRADVKDRRSDTERPDRAETSAAGMEEKNRQTALADAENRQEAREDAGSRQEEAQVISEKRRDLQRKLFEKRRPKSESRRSDTERPDRADTSAAGTEISGAEERRRLNHLERLLNRDPDEEDSPRMPQKTASAGAKTGTDASGSGTKAEDLQHTADPARADAEGKTGAGVSAKTPTGVETEAGAFAKIQEIAEAGASVDIPSGTGAETETSGTVPQEGGAGAEASGKAPKSKENKPKRNKSKNPDEKPEKVKSRKEKRLKTARIQDFLQDLSQKGIQSKELIMLGAVALFLILLILIAVNAFRGAVDQRQKSRNVTADDGLVVTVEEEPSSWTSSYLVKLRISVKNESISSISVNGQACQQDENGIVTVDADDWLLDIEVRTESGTKKARAEIEYLDGDAPVLEIKNEGNQIVLTAVDARSSVTGIYYAATPENHYFQLPVYQEYTGAIPYEEGTVYRFYTEDQAGNRSLPVVTTLETAESFTLNTTETTLFPGESLGLAVTAEPEGALLENVKYESMDENVVTVASNGKITAVGNGTSAVRVTSGGLGDQVCTVTVSNERTVTVSTIGDCTLGSDESFNTSTNFDAFYAVNGADYFFQNVRDILSQDDVTFANLEGTLTDSTARENKQYAFKGDPSYTEILTSGSVEVVTLANNHSSDYGAESLTDTQEALSEAGIDYCNGDEIVIREVNGVQVAFIGIYVLDVGMERESQVKETISRAQRQGADLIIVAFHWGSEKANYPDETQTSLAHTAIDCGADLVVGHHPHVLQGIEKYNGKYIVYSLANFCFGGNNAPSDTDTIIFQQTFTISTAGVEDTDEIRIIPCKVSSASGYNNYQPTPADDAEAEAIISRLNEYSAAYGQTYTAAE